MKMLPTCFSTAPRLMFKDSAIAEFDLPSAMSPSTSSSREVILSMVSTVRLRPTSCATTSGSIAVPPGDVERQTTESKRPDLCP